MIIIKTDIDNIDIDNIDKPTMRNTTRCESMWRYVTLCDTM